MLLKKTVLKYPWAVGEGHVVSLPTMVEILLKETKQNILGRCVTAKCLPGGAWIELVISL